MAKRISRKEFDARLAKLKADYVADMQSAAGDSGKTALAENRRRWAEEAAREAFNQRSGLYRFFDSLPLIGKPLAILVESVENAREEHGRFLGLAMGLFSGLIVAVALVVTSEGVILAFDIGRSWLEIHAGARIKAGQRAEAANTFREHALKAYYAEHPDKDPSTRAAPVQIPGGVGVHAQQRENPAETQREQELKSYYAEHPDKDPSKRDSSPTDNLDAFNAVTLSKTPFVEITDDQYNDARKALIESDATFQSDMQRVAARLAGSTDFLLAGTRYAPCLKDSNDPASTVTIRGADRQPPAILVNVRSETYGYRIHGILLESEYNVFLQKLKSDAAR
jgi:hypothetical protein